MLLSQHSGFGNFHQKPNSGFGNFLGVEPLEKDFEKWHSLKPFFSHSTQTLLSFTDGVQLLQFDIQQLSHIPFLLNVPSGFVWNNLNSRMEPSLSILSPSRMESVSQPSKLSLTHPNLGSSLWSLGVHPCFFFFEFLFCSKEEEGKEKS